MQFHNFFLKNIQKKFDIKDINYIKPGIGEATRVLLRRVPHLIMVKNLNSSQIEHLKLLAIEKGVKIIEEKNLPYTALAIIRDVLK